LCWHCQVAHAAVFEASSQQMIFCCILCVSHSNSRLQTRPSMCAHRISVWSLTLLLVAACVQAACLG
jgi:hypothetical protein